MRTIIKNGLIVNESTVFPGDILIEKGIIREIGQGLSDPDAQEIDAAGKYVLPGAVDVHTHKETLLFFVK